MRLVALLLGAATLLTAFMAAAPAGQAVGAHTCPAVDDYPITLPHAVAQGLVATPCTQTPGTLVVVTHGRNNDAESHRGHLLQMADLGAVAVAMSYTGGNFALGNGTVETIAAMDKLLAAYPTLDRVVMFSVSMGTPVGAWVMAQRPGVVDDWVVAEPMANVIETYFEARAACVAVADACPPVAEMHRECDGGFDRNPACYVDRTAVRRLPQFVGLDHAYVISGPNDGVTPYNQARELSEGLRARTVPTDFVTVLRGAPGGEGTTLTGYGGRQVDGAAGHGSERNDTHTLTVVSWEVMRSVVGEDPGWRPSMREWVWDRDLGMRTVVPPGAPALPPGPALA